MLRLLRTPLRPAPFATSTVVRADLLTRRFATVRDISPKLNIQQRDSKLQLSGESLPQPLTLPYAWLRDSCQCPQCVHPTTKQKLARTGDFLSSTPNSVTIQNDNVRIQWGGRAEQHGAHDSTYSLSFLKRYAEPTGHVRHTSHYDDILARQPWDLASFPTPAPHFIPYRSFKADPLPGFIQVLKHGILLLRGVPHEWTERGTRARSAVEELAEEFGVIRETMYGRMWDVVSKKASTNIAFTNLKLDLHMDLMYLQNPPHIQFLHCIKNQVEGGRSVFVDGLKAAQDLWHQDRAAFQLLANTPIPFHYENDGHHLHRSHPTIELAPNYDQHPSSSDVPPPIAEINYAPPFQAPLPITAPIKLYTALQQFTHLLARPEARFEYLLHEGDCAVFDNRRVLHARTAFWDRNARQGEANETNRWMKGCYVERDDLLNRTRGLLAKAIDGESINLVDRAKEIGVAVAI
ncbi:hypothetical protein FRC09_000657 [Ceratobasidium sp. 395]|nr:hypothetical protein FRC09_000657 [Ceratobasidium sp. 395]